MFGIGMNEMLVIAILAVVVVGPKRLPEVARTMGKLMAQFKRATNDLRDAVNNEISSHEEIRDLKELRSLKDFKELRQMGSEVQQGLRDVERVARDEARKGEQALNTEVDGSHPDLPEDGPFGSVAKPAKPNIAPPDSLAPREPPAPADAAPADDDSANPAEKTVTKR